MISNVGTAQVSKQPKCPSVEKRINKTWSLVFVAVCIPTNGILFHLKKEGNSNTGYREPGGYFAKWNKPVIRGQMLCDPTCMTYLEKLNSFRQKWISGQELRGEWYREVFNGYRISLFQEFWRCCRTMCICLQFRHCRTVYLKMGKTLSFTVVELILRQ